MNAPSALNRITATLLAMSAGALLTIILYAAVDARVTQVYAQDRPTQSRFDRGPAGPLPATNAGPALDRGNLAAADLSTAFRRAAVSVRPSVVSIQTRVIETVRSRSTMPGVPPEFERFFGRPSQPRQRESVGRGSGVIVRSDGYILTNNHVVEGADELVVEMANGDKIPGNIVGTDPQTDLAVVKIDRNDVVAMKLGSSDAIRVGDWVLAIGSPFGLDQTVTAGIISAKNRVQEIIDNGKGFEDFLQTDAAINPGNSGGALVNLRGELIGINTAILSRAGGNSGIGFAIPVSMAVPVLESIIETGEVHRGFLGAKVIDITPQWIERYDLRVRKGAFIFEVLAKRPAEAAGLQPGDVVTQIENTPCVSGTQLRTFVASRRPGETFQVTVDRSGRRFTTTIKLDERTDEALSAFGAGEILGSQVVPITPTTARQYGYSEEQTGLIVIGVDDDSVADQMGLQVGDIIESAAGIRLDAASQFNLILEELRGAGKICRTVIRRGQSRIMVAIE